MRHEKEWYTCDRSGVNIESKFVYTLLKEDIEKNALPADGVMKIIGTHMFCSSRLDLCPKCRKDFERFMDNE